MTEQTHDSQISLRSLAELNNLLENKQFDQFWKRAVTLLHRATAAEGVRLYWADNDRADQDQILHAGETPDAGLAYCAQWESTSLTNMPIFGLAGGLGAGLGAGLGDGENENSPDHAESQRIRGHILGPSSDELAPDELAPTDKATSRKPVMAPVQFRPLPTTLSLGRHQDLDGFRAVHVWLVIDNIAYGSLSLFFGPGRSLSMETEELLALVDLLTHNFVRAQALEAARSRLENVSLLYQFNQAVTSLDLNQVLWDAAELVAFLLDAEAASIFLVDAERKRLKFMVATGQTGSELIGTQIDIDHGLAGWVTTHGLPLIVNDPQNDARFSGDLDRQTGFVTRNILCVPLIIKKRTIGVVQVLNCQGGFTPQDQEWVTSVSGQISIAVENARLYGREHDKVKELATLNHVSQAITSALDVREVINAITDYVVEILAVDRSELLLLNQQRDYLDIYSVTGASIGQHWAEKPVPLTPDSLVGWCVERGTSVAVARVGDDPRCDGMFEDPSMDESSLAMVPLINRGETIGVIVAYSTKGRIFDEERLNLLQTFANQAAVALENATLYQNLQSEQERIISIQEDVRHQLARDLHDGPAQMLSSIVLSVDLTRRFLTRSQSESAYGELDRLEEVARQANREVRTLLFELRPIILESRGLIPALYAYHRQLSGTISSRVKLEIVPMQETFSPRASNSIFAIIQEAVNNVRKHAQANSIWIRAYVEEENLIFEIEDDGVGMDVSRLQENYSGRNSFGLLNMRERASILGGRLSFRSPRSNDQAGTVIVGVVPLANILGEPNPDFSLF